MDISSQIDAVYRRALLLRQYALDLPAQPAQQEILDKALKELYFVLEELQTSQEELHQQNRELMITRQAVELERQHYRILFDLAPYGYLITNLQGNIQQANYQMSQLLGCTQDHVINKPLLVFIHEPDRRYFQTQLTTYMPGKPWQVRLKRPNQVLTSVDVSVSCIHDPKQHKDRLLWSFYDLSHLGQTGGDQS